MESVKRLALRMKIRKLTGTVVHHCAILVKMLDREGIRATIVKGWAVADGEVCEHYWVKTTDEEFNMDVGYELACLFTPELKGVTPVLLTELPDGFKQVSEENDNGRLHALYMSDPAAFWREAPGDVRGFK